jgi:hypothetical protein
MTNKRWRTQVLLSLAISFVVAFIAILPARSDCSYNGKVYQTGDTNDQGKICTPQGTWQ